MKTNEQIIEFILKQKVAFIASVDAQGFPNVKAMFIPRKIDGNNCSRQHMKSPEVKAGCHKDILNIL